MNQRSAPAKSSRHRQLADAPKKRTLALAISMVLGSIAAPRAVMAGPEGGQVVAGAGSITQSGASTVITQSSDRLAINWQSFNVAQNENVRFDQPSTSSVAMNRIFDQNPSQILGSIDANGHVLLINPNGMVFGESARLNVGSLIASSLDISLSDFMAGKNEFAAKDGVAGAVINRGLIQAATGGSVTLLGGSVANEGVIVADLGQVTLGAGTHAALDFDGDGLLYFSIDGDALAAAGADSAVANSGTIQANGGKVLLSGRAAQNVFSNVVNNTGVIRAARIDNSGGEIRLVGAGDAPVLTSGTLDASGGDAASTGGRIEILGDKVGVESDASVLADGQAGGGTILVGGDAHGGGGVQTAEHAFVGRNAKLSADGLNSGDGGRVVVWANQGTRFYGDISARGGATGGDGGFVETSGKSFLQVDGSVHTGAANGKGGTWLLDPDDITIEAAAQTGIDQTGTGDPGPVLFGIDTANTPGTIDVANINAALDDGSDVVISTASGGTGAGNITVNAAILKSQDDEGASQNNGSTLTMNADGNIVVNQSITSTEGALHVNLNANGSVAVNNVINAAGGNISIVVDADEAAVGRDGAESLTIAGNGALIGTNVNLQGGGTVQNDSLVVSLAGGATANWNVIAANDGTLTATGSAPAVFTDFASLVGGDQADTFNLDATFGGDIDGNAGIDVLDMADIAGARNIMLTNAGANGFSGTDPAVTRALTGSFEDIDDIRGGDGTDRVTGLNRASTWTLDGTNTYTEAVGNQTLAFSSFETLSGGTDVDTFAVSANFTGSVDGNDGADVLDFTGFATGRAIALTGLGSTDGFDGTEASVSVGFLDIDTIIGSGNTDSLAGLNLAATWRLDGTPTYEAGASTLNFSTIEVLNGGSDADTFKVDAAFAGTLNGGLGMDVLDYTTFNAIHNFGLNGVVASGFSGAEILSSIGFTGIDRILAGPTADTLTGLNATATWGLDGTPTYTSGGVTLEFSNVENLAGGADADTFDVDAPFAGTIDGNAGNDVLDLSALGANVQLTAGAADGFAGTDASIVGGFFSDIDSLIGGAGADTLTGLNAGATWLLGGTPTYVAGGGTVAFTSFENLVGGNAADTFAVSAAFTGTVDGNAGADVLDLSGFASGRAVVLTALGATDGFDGTEASVSGGFRNIDTLVGGAGTDSLTGLNATSTWALDGTPTYMSTNTLAFSAIESLIGGSAADTFDVDAVFGGSVHGNGGIDVLDLGSFATTRAVVLTAGAANGFAGNEASLTGGFDGIETIAGGAASDDSITGFGATATWDLDGTPTYASGGNTLSFSALESLRGGPGADTFNVSAVFAGAVDGNAGLDVLNLAGIPGARAVTLTVSGANGFAGTEAAVTGGFADIDSIVGGAGTDSLTGLNAPATWDIGVTDTYTNNLGNNTLTFSSFENFTGNSDVDVFNFSRAYAGNVSGAGGPDVFNFNASGVVTGTVAGNGGNDAFHFNGGNLIGTGTGDAGDDSFTLDDPASVVTATLDAGTTGETAGDSIVGSPNPDTFAFAGVTTTLSNGTGGSLAVDNVENLGGGAGADVFTFTSPFAGRVDGDAGVDILDLSAIAGQQNVTLISVNTDGFTGTSTAVAGGFADIDDIRVGADVSDTLVGLDASATWDLGINRYTSGGNVLVFLGFENLTGGTGADAFSFVGAGTRGTILGGAGDDDFSFDGNWTVTAVNGGAGDDTFHLATASTVVTGNIDAGSGGEINGDTVIGPATPTTFLVAGPGVVALAASPGTMTVSNVENLTGGAGADTFSFSGAGNITGTALGAGGADTFDLDVAIAGRVDGGAGADVLDLSSIATARNVILGSANANGFTGTEAALAAGAAAGFANIDEIRAGATANDALTGLNGTAAWTLAGVPSYSTGGNTLLFSSFETLHGGTGTDTLTGDDVANAFVVTGANQGTLNGGAFTAIENLVGNAQADTFTLVGGTLTGTVDGAGGSDALIGDNVQNAFVVTGANAGTATGIGGFVNVENLTGNAQPDTFTLAGGTLSGAIDGASGQDRLNGDNVANTFVVNAANAGTATGVGGGFSNIEELAGNAQADTFTLNAALTGAVSGGGGDDTFALNDGGAVGSIDGGAENDTVTFAGRTSGVLAGTSDYASIENLIGTAFQDTLVGTNNADAFVTTGVTSGTVSTGGNTVVYTSFENLQGADGDDTFTINSSIGGGAIAGGNGNDEFQIGPGINVPIDGEAGNDRLVMTGSQAATITVAAANQGTVNDGTGTVAFAGIENLVAGLGDDTINVNANIATIAGGPGNDTFNLGAGVSTAINGGAGTNTLAAAASQATQFAVTAANGGTVTNGGGTVTFSNAQNLTGGSQNDTFTLDAALFGAIQGLAGNDVIAINDGGSAGSIDGGAGTDQVTYAGSTGPISIPFNLYAGVESLVGTASTDDVLQGTAGNDAFASTGANAGTVGGVTFSSFETLAGNDGNDTFSIGHAFRGIVGGNGTDVLDFSSSNAANTVTLTSPSAGAGFGGTATVVGTFDGIDEIRAGAGADSLTGLNAASTWTLGAANTYASTGTGTLAFSGFETLNGGTAADTFNVGAASVGGTLNGGAGDDRFNVNASAPAAMNGGAGDDYYAFANGVIAGGTVDGGAGTDVLDLSAYTSARNVTITAVRADGFDGSETSVTTGFRNIDDLRGSATAADVITGLANAQAAWVLAGDTGNRYTTGGSTLAFSSFATVNGTGGVDTFTLGTGGQTGTQTGSLVIAGAGGADSLDVAGGFTVNAGDLTLTDVETIRDSSGAVVTAGTLRITGASGGVGEAGAALKTDVNALQVVGGAVTLEEQSGTVVLDVDSGAAAVNVSVVTGDAVLGLLKGGSVTVQASHGNVLHNGGPLSPDIAANTVVLRASAGAVGTEAQAVVLDVPASGSVVINTFTGATIENLQGAPVTLTGSNVLRERSSGRFAAATGVGTVNAAEALVTIDWAGLDPNVALVDCLQPCVKLPADQSEDAGLAQLREATKLLLIRTDDGWKMIPVVARETIAAN